MLIWSTVFIFIVHYSSIKSFPVEEQCNDIFCSNVLDPVCGISKTMDDTRIIRKYQNICHLNKAKCRLQSIAAIEQIPEAVCGIRPKMMYIGRRVYDYSIVGAHQACNHTCPTFCIDTYEPACAQIWKPGMKKYVYRPMINHCHIDLFSCALAVNVTIHPLGRCYKNPAGLMFMTQVAALKSLHLLDDGSEGVAPGAIPNSHALPMPKIH